MTDVRKLYKVAGILEIEFEGRPVNDVAKDVATTLLTTSDASTVVN